MVYVQSVHMTSYVHRIEVHYTLDPRLAVRTDRIRSLGFPVDKLHLIDVYTIATSSRDFTPDELSQIGGQLINPVVQEYTVDKATSAVFDYAIEVGFLPGVTDNVGTTARQTIEDYFSMTFCEGEACILIAAFFCLREPPGISPAETCINAGKSAREPGPDQNPAGIREQRHGSGRSVRPPARTADCRNG